MLHVAHFRKAAKYSSPIGGRSFEKNNLAVIIPSKAVLESNFCDVYQISDVFENFTVDNPEGLVFTHLSEGIGDIVALSSLVAYLATMDKEINIHVSKKMWPVFEMYETNNYRLKEFSAPIVRNFSLATRLSGFDMKRIPLEWSVTNGGRKNWYKIYFSKIGLTHVPSEYMRPRLFTGFLKAEYEGMKEFEPNSVLICHKSSCQIRSSSLMDFYIALRESMPHLIYSVHKRDCTPEEIEFAIQNGIELLNTDSIEDYMSNVATFPLVVSTDTAAIHIREGLERPALGVYGAFSIEARTKGYKYTHSFNVKTGCEFQPCFKHQRKAEDRCQKYTGVETAPCQSGEKFRDQLRAEFVKYYLKIKKQ